MCVIKFRRILRIYRLIKVLFASQSLFLEAKRRKFKLFRSIDGLLLSLRR
jgi:hypothetical protein